MEFINFIYIIAQHNFTFTQFDKILLQISYAVAIVSKHTSPGRSLIRYNDLTFDGCITALID